MLADVFYLSSFFSSCVFKHHRFIFHSVVSTGISNSSKFSIICKLHLSTTCCLCKITNKNVNHSILESCYNTSSCAGQVKMWGKFSLTNYEDALLVCLTVEALPPQCLPRGSLRLGRDLVACCFLSCFHCVKMSFLKLKKIPGLC